MNRVIWIMRVLYRSVGHAKAAILCLQVTARPRHVINAAILCLQVTARPLGHVWEVPTDDQLESGPLAGEGFCLRERCLESWIPGI